jgi:SAM-dependent methyltransferase
VTPDYDRIRTAYDRLAPHHDDVFGPQNDPNLARLRSFNLDLLSSLFPPGAWVLDVGCGVAEEAIALARQGCRVWGIDLSPGMIDAAQARVWAAGVADRVTLKVLPAHRVAELLGEIPAERLDGAWSSFGVLNLEPDLQAVRDGLAQLLRPSGRLALGALNDRCRFETVYQYLHGRPSLARARQKGEGELELPVPGGAVTVPVRFIEPQALADAFKPHFSVERSYALATVTPPAGMPGVFTRHRPLFTGLARIDAACRQFPSFIRSSDQYVITMRRDMAGVDGSHGPHWLANG